ncbi:MULTISPECIES: hypothetical protein [Streptomyces]|uniref:hypothetical protein n=1 Tax=Streptomyces TaxID=1883 RepID=UPI001315FA13|nr:MULTISPECIES: hypothetical protein [Streptomyces]QGZ49666.1 hypothetical protein GPZ77_15935 [Streptomyces sp. QHH-9511]GGT70111.1 hypothetical protein GCM10010272_11540 [Streptomyces lateritius]
MGWTYDYGDTARDRRSATVPGAHERSGPEDHGRSHSAQEIGIPHILRRRARWVSARLRHTRD